MGKVYLGRDPDLERDVAIKVLRSESAEQGQRRKRLVREAKSLARLHHPNVVQVFEVGVDGGQLFIVMELVEGQTLRQWLDESGASWSEVLAADTRTRSTFATLRLISEASTWATRVMSTRVTSCRFRTLFLALPLGLALVGCDLYSQEAELREGATDPVQILIELAALDETDFFQLFARLGECGEYEPGYIWHQSSDLCTCTVSGITLCARAGIKASAREIQPAAPAADGSTDSENGQAPPVALAAEVGAGDCGQYDVGESWWDDCSKCSCLAPDYVECTDIDCTDQSESIWD